ncbi:MAG: hypothetical protein IJA95_07320 [Bacteroidaceae bacterium]|nr:hypothetical protein [Bacteroidaceae bacterium]
MMEEKQSPYQWAKNRDGYPVLLRTKHPRLAIEVQDEVDSKQLADALRKATEFVLKGERIEKPKPQEQRYVVRRNGQMYAVEMSELTLSDEGNVVGEICDDKCDTSCMHYRTGTCPFNNMRMTGGERVRVWNLDE